jgi:hypothetical protein
MIISLLFRRIYVTVRIHEVSHVFLNIISFSLVLAVDFVTSPHASQTAVWGFDTMLIHHESVSRLVFRSLHCLSFDSSFLFLLSVILSSAGYFALSSIRLLRSLAKLFSSTNWGLVQTNKPVRVSCSKTDVCITAVN